MLMYILFGFCITVLILNIWIWILIHKMNLSKKEDGDSRNQHNEAMGQSFISLKENQKRIEDSVKSEFSNNRKEQTAQAQALRQEVTDNVQKYNQAMTDSFKNLSDTQRQQLDSFEQRFITMSEGNIKQQEALKASMESSLKSIQQGGQQQMDSFEKRFDTMSKANIKKQEDLKTSVESSLKNLQQDNQQQLDKMRTTVDEKLQGTLEKRLSESFGQVSQRLEQVYKGLGEMRVLTDGVGDLKRVLTNVKSRGVWGEFQLGNILEEILSPEQYEKNVTIKRGSQESVEYAVKLPGQGDGECVYLPIDSKFPLEDYQKLIKAQEDADAEALKIASVHLEANVKREARTIRDKYIAPPRTTDFAVMFLPTEGLYAEILRMPGLVDQLLRQYRIIVSGPTTLSALLNSLSVGFRTLAIQKRSSEVWRLLAAIKTQFGTFSGLLENVHKKLNTSLSEMEKASKKSKIIEKRLGKIEELPVSEAQRLLPELEDEK